jgi:carboxypeptidase Taq
MIMTFSRIDSLCRKLEALEHAQAMLGVDEAVNMPVGGGEKRAEAMAGLAGMYHDMAAAPEIAEWIADAERESLDDAQRVAMREFNRSYVNLTCLSSAFVHKQTAGRIKCEQLWRQLRAKGDWKNFLPAFEGVIALAREEAALRSEVLNLSPYDAMMEQYDPGNRAADITPVFGALKVFLKGFVPEALEGQKVRRKKYKPKGLAKTYPIEKQKALGVALMQAVGFDMTHGRLDISHHPFCGGVPDDVRMTTRYTTKEFLSSLLGILHETGHGLYEQGLPKQWRHMPVGRARGMGAHESQSLFVEMILARTPAFWEFALPVARKTLGREAMPGWQVRDVLARLQHVEKGFIRVEADEVTYPLHVILRFELEHELISGKLAARDLPEAWDAKMREYLGLSTIDNMKDGPMQDVHWPAGAFGYFPSYTLGAMMAAQQWAAIERKHPTVMQEIAKGNFKKVNDWRRKNIWERASFVSTPELMREATGEPLDAKYFIAHVKKRYLD